MGGRGDHSRIIYILNKGQFVLRLLGGCAKVGNSLTEALGMPQPVGRVFSRRYILHVVDYYH